MKVRRASQRVLQLSTLLCVAVSAVRTAENPDPCKPSPCGSSLSCRNVQGQAECYCRPGQCNQGPGLCSSLTFPSRVIECEMDGKKVDCNKTIAPETKAFLRCNTQYTNEPEFAEYEAVCKQNGQWSPPVTPCIPICGTLNPDGVPLIANGVIAKPGQFPWHAGIYQMRDGTVEILCGGTIVSPRAIVTAAHCLWNDNSDSPADFKNYKVVVGQYFREWNKRIKPDYAQVLEVKSVEIHRRFRGAVRNYAFNIAIVVLNSEIQMTTGVRPICVDYKKDYTYLFTPGKTGRVAGWGLTESNIQSDVLRSGTFPLVDTEECENAVPDSFLPFLTPDVFCAGNLNGTSLCVGDSGGGYAAKFQDGKWYLMGIVSLGLASNDFQCNTNAYTAFTRVSEYYEFIQEFATKLSIDSANPCKPSPCGPNTQCRDISGKAECSCLPNYVGRPPNCRPVCRPGTCGHNAQCDVMEDSIICTCLSGHIGDPYSGCCPANTGKCPPLMDSTREIECISNGQETNCRTPVAPGTKASVRCKTHYENIPSLEVYDMKCKENGQWSRVLQPCAPICGEENPQGLPLIGGGERTNISQYPWHIGLYKENATGQFEYQCGGSLVSDRIIVTAAHCFAENTTMDMQKEVTKYKAVAGKYYRHWNNNNKFNQHLEIMEIVPHSRYKGQELHYQNDIAVIILKYKVEIGNAVRPVCLDYAKKFLKYFIPGIEGKVVGWGKTEGGELSDEVRSASLPFANPTDCEEKSPQDFRGFIIGDKFCAGKEKTTVCQGDSGGGYAVQFRESKKWYLVGIVSIGPTARCTEYPYVAFTALYTHIDFVMSHLTE